MDTLTLKLSPRSVRGKKVKQLRRGGLVPVHFYGRGTEPLAMQVEAGVLRRLISRAGQNIPIAVELEGRSGENICFVREVQRHPVTDEVLHVDFLRVDITRTVSAEVPLTITGISPAVTEMAGTLLQNIQTLSIEALPMNMPAEIPVDVSGLIDFDTSLLVRDAVVPGNVTVLNYPDDAIVRVAPPRLEVETFEGEEGEEGVAEGEEGTEGADEADDES